MQNPKNKYKSHIIAFGLLLTLSCASLTTFSQTPDTTASKNANGNTIFTAVEVQPAFPGGAQGFGKFLSDHIHYPVAAKQQNIQGRVFAQFVVEKDGSLTDIKIMREPGGGLGDEAIRVLNLSPKWQPGTQSGKPVRVQFTVPINFSLANSPSTYGPPTQIVRNIPAPDTAGGKVFSAVQIQPIFPGGESAFSKFLADNIKYPLLAKRNNVTGRVFVQFIVEADGRLTNMFIVRDPGQGLGDEAVRVLKLSPKWKPGLQNNVPVRVQYTVPINFSLN